MLGILFAVSRHDDAAAVLALVYVAAHPHNDALQSGDGRRLLTILCDWSGDKLAAVTTIAAEHGVISVATDQGDQR
jgi:hypothetical protein